MVKNVGELVPLIFCKILKGFQKIKTTRKRNLSEWSHIPKIKKIKKKGDIYRPFQRWR